MKSGLHLLGKFVWVWTALVSIKAGLRAFGYDHYARWAMEYPQLVRAMCGISVIAGVVSLVMLFMACKSSCCSACGCKTCTCKPGYNNNNNNPNRM